MDVVMAILDMSLKIAFHKHEICYGIFIQDIKVVYHRCWHTEKEIAHETLNPKKRFMKVEHLPLLFYFNNLPS